MKKQFSKEWKASRQIRKQRKFRANASSKIKHEFLSSNLSEELRKKYARKSFPIRKGDVVKIMRGEYKGKSGKVSLIDLKKTKVAIEGIQLTRKDGTKVNVKFHASNLQIQELNMEDKKRMDSITKINKEIKK
jgi:large subunit ribosomal protein L24